MKLAALEVLDFWFGPPDDPGHALPRKAWFSKDAAFDATIAQRFLCDDRDGTGRRPRRLDHANRSPRCRHWRWSSCSTSSRATPSGQRARLCRRCTRAADGARAGRVGGRPIPERRAAPVRLPAVRACRGTCRTSAPRCSCSSSSNTTSRRWWGWPNGHASTTTSSRASAAFRTATPRSGGRAATEELAFLQQPGSGF